MVRRRRGTAWDRLRIALSTRRRAVGGIATGGVDDERAAGLATLPARRNSAPVRTVVQSRDLERRLRQAAGSSVSTGNARQAGHESRLSLRGPLYRARRFPVAKPKPHDATRRTRPGPATPSRARARRAP